MISREEYFKILNSGMFWEWFPEASGIYEEDIKNVKFYSK
jgi:hypothetical protein